VITAFSDSTAAFGLPGRFRINDEPQMPHRPRLRAARGVFFAPSLRMRSGMPSTRRPQTARVASGVTSRAAMPVPPVVTISGNAAARRRNAASSVAWSSGTTSILSTTKWFFCKSSRTAGPERSERVPEETESLMVRTTLLVSGFKFPVSSCRGIPVESAFLRGFCGKGP